MGACVAKEKELNVSYIIIVSYSRDLSEPGRTA